MHNQEFMTTLSRFIALLLLLAVGIAACDSSEDPNLLNPPPPDSTQIRTINLLGGQTIDFRIGGGTVASGLSPFIGTSFSNILIQERTFFVIGRSNRSDTIANQQLPLGANVTFLVYGRDTLPQLKQLQTSNQDRLDLTTAGRSRLIFINTVPDSTLYVRRGCQSGDTLLGGTGFGISTTADIPENAVSLYLFTAGIPSPVTTARLALPTGSTTYLIAARRNGAIELFTIDAATGFAGSLPTAPPETRTESAVALINAIDGNATVSASMKGSGIVIATGVPTFGVSSEANVQACQSPSGDSVDLTTSAGQSFSVGIRLSVGGRSFAVLYNNLGITRALVLDRAATQVPSGKARIRVVNVANDGRYALVIGSGSPRGDSANTRPFGSQVPGAISPTVDLPAGNYPLLLSDDASGRFVESGMQTLTEGSWTIFVVSNNGVASLRVLREDGNVGGLQPLESVGRSAVLFSMIPDGNASITLGQLTPSPIGYSYVRYSVIPSTQFQATLNGTATQTVDGMAADYVIGATGTMSAPQLIVFPQNSEATTAGKASVRFINAAPTETTLELRESSISTDPLRTSDFGKPSDTIQREERKYSFIVSRPGQQTVLARIDGVELSAGRRYLLVVGPKRTTSTNDTLQYRTLWMQE